MPDILKSPIPYLGGKQSVSKEIWTRFGNVDTFIDPFFGSGAVLFGSSTKAKLEIVNDKDGYIVNFFRALACDPDVVAKYADNPVFESELHARHSWLVGKRQELTAKLEGNPDWFDAKIAGWWAWGLSSWIGTGWCSGEGPWKPVNGILTKNPVEDGDLFDLAGEKKNGINRKIPELVSNRGVRSERADNLSVYFRKLHDRLKDVIVCCGNWDRVLGDSVLNSGTVAIVLDPPYSLDDREKNCYANDSVGVAEEVREWAIKHGDNPNLRIALCGYESERYRMPDNWEAFEWKAQGGYSNQDSDNSNRFREKIWFSESCCGCKQVSIFEKISKISIDNV